VRLRQTTNAFWARLAITIRSEHSLIVFVAPLDDDTALKHTQITQLFWNTIAIELFLVCFMGSFGQTQSGAGGRRGGQSASLDAGVPSFVETFNISPVDVVTTGFLSSAITFTVTALCVYAFKLSNSRTRKDRGSLSQRLTSLWRRTDKKMHGDNHAPDDEPGTHSRLQPVSRSTAPSSGSHRVSGQCALPWRFPIRRAKQPEDSKSRQRALEGSHSEKAGPVDDDHHTMVQTCRRIDGVEDEMGVSETGESEALPDFTVEDMGDDITGGFGDARPRPPRRITSTPTITGSALRVPSPSLLTPPPSPPVPDAQQHEEADRLHADSVSTSAPVPTKRAYRIPHAEKLQSARGWRRALRTCTSRVSPAPTSGMREANSPAKASSGCADLATKMFGKAQTDLDKRVRVVNPRAAFARGAHAGARVTRACANFRPNTIPSPHLSQLSQRPDNMASAAFELLHRKRTAELRWRSNREVALRQCLAWALSIFVMFTSCWYSFVVAVTFGDAAVRGALLSWLVAYGWTFALVEPVQILVIAGAPCVWNGDEDSRCGRWCARARFFYNEFLSP